MRSDVCQTHRLTSDPSDNTFSETSGVIQGLIVLDFTNIMRKIDMFCISVINGKLNINSENRHGYVGTMVHHKERNFVYTDKRTVGVNYDPINTFLNAHASKCKVADKFLKPL